MNKPMVLGFLEGGVFRITGLTVEDQDELTAVMMRQLLAPDSPISENATSLVNTFQCAAFRPLMNI